MDAVAPTAITAAPANWMKGTADNRPMAMHDPIGVCSFGFTLASAFEKGSWLSRAIPKHRRMVDVSMAMQHTKMAADTTSRYTVDRADDRTESMIAAGPKKFLIAFPRLGMAMSVPHRKTTPIRNAPTTDPRTALGASRRGSRVSSASVEAVSIP